MTPRQHGQALVRAFNNFALKYPGRHIGVAQCMVACDGYTLIRDEQLARLREDLFACKEMLRSRGIKIPCN